MVPIARLLPRMDALLKKPALGAWFRYQLLTWLLLDTVEAAPPVLVVF